MERLAEMSIQLVLSHYLAGLRERDELDALLPELLKAMGHSVLSRPQVGVAQAGVDVVSSCVNEAGAEEVFLFVIKFGDVGRDDFYAGKQSIDPSIREAANDFVRNRLPEKFGTLRKRIVLLTNGGLKQEAQAGYSALSYDVADRPLCSLEFWGTDQITPLIEQHLFDESLLLEKGKSHLRAALAGLDESEIAVQRFMRFVDSCLEHEPELDKSISTRKKRFHRRCAAASMGWAVLLVWGQSEGNLKPGVVGGEYLALRMWSAAVTEAFSTDAVFIDRLTQTLLLLAKSLHSYFEKSVPQLLNRRAILAYRPAQLFYAELIFEEVGRLASLLLLIQNIQPEETDFRSELKLGIVNLINEHRVLFLPVYDGHTIELTLILAALLGEGDLVNVKNILAEVSRRFLHALRVNRYLPVDTDTMEDALALNVSKEVEAREFFKTSSLFPALGSVSAFVDDTETFRRLREDVYPLLKDVTLERWFPDKALETLTGSNLSVYDVGVSMSIVGLRATTREESEASLKLIPGAAGPNTFNWHGSPFSILVALSSRLHRHPVPTYFLKERADAERRK